MSRYRVLVHSYVVVEAPNEKQAKADAELAVRGAVGRSLLDGFSRRLTGSWEHFGFVAKGKPERLGDDE